MNQLADQIVPRPKATPADHTERRLFGNILF